MANLEMGERPIELTNNNVNNEVIQGSIGNYGLGTPKEEGSVWLRVEYVGRSDNDLQKRLNDHVGEEYTHFKFRYKDTDVEAWKLECMNLHNFSRAKCEWEPLDNERHPARPSGWGDKKNELPCPWPDCDK